MTTTPDQPQPVPDNPDQPEPVVPADPDPQPVTPDPAPSEGAGQG